MPGKSRTFNIQSRNLILYPIELQAHRKRASAEWPKESAPSLETPPRGESSRA